MYWAFFYWLCWYHSIVLIDSLFTICAYAIGVVIMRVIFSSLFTQDEVIDDIVNLSSNIRWLEFAKGCYEGSCEPAYIVHTGYEMLSELLELVLVKYNQDACLVIDCNEECLMYLKEAPACGIPMGKWKKTTQATALKQDAYTCIKGEYFIIN